MHQTRLVFISVFALGLNILPLNANQFAYPGAFVQVRGVGYANHPGNAPSYSDQCACETPQQPLGPIHIDTKNVFKEQFTPLIMNANLKDEVLIENDGKSIRLFPAKKCVKSSISGGSFEFETYVFHSKKYLWTLDSNGTAGTTIDDKRFILEDIATLFNEKYRTFDEATKHRNGIVELHFPISESPCPNLLFEGYAKHLKKVDQPNSCAKTTFSDATSWFSSLIPLNNTYYLYSGASTDQKTGRIYTATHIIIEPTPQMFISRDQVAETYGQLLDCSGQRMVPTGNRCQSQETVPVLSAIGIIAVSSI